MRLSPTHVAFLRAINVRGHTTVSMRDLTKAFTTAGCTSVRSVIQSGNVLFTPPTGTKAAVLEHVRRRVQNEIGSELAVFFRPVRELEQLIDNHPFRQYARRRELKRYVAFLARRPRRKMSLPIRSRKERLEAIGLTGCNAFIVSARKPSGFYGFPNNFIEAELGVSATTRNWSTITKIVSLVRED